MSLKDAKMTSLADKLYTAATKVVKSAKGEKKSTKRSAFTSKKKDD
jgi:hypothetical protein